jgi:hypothetical protein
MAAQNSPEPKIRGDIRSTTIECRAVFGSLAERFMGPGRTRSFIEKMETSFNHWIEKTEELYDPYSCLDDDLENYPDAKESIIDLLEVLAICLQYCKSQA